MPTVACRATRPEVRRILAGLVSTLAGRVPDAGGYARQVQLRMGVALLSKIQQAFLVKSRGGTGEDGIKWDPLKPETIAQRRTTRSERKTLGITGRRVRGLLTPAEDSRWRGIFAGILAKLRAQGMGNGEAKAIAARIAWARLKEAGAKTKLAVLGSRTVDIGRDSGRMFRSLTPGVQDRPSNAPEQVFEVPPGAVIVGSKVPYFARFHARRPAWPRRLPESWWKAIGDAGVRGLLVAAQQILGSRR